MKGLCFALAAILVAGPHIVASSQPASSRPVLAASTYWGGSGAERSVSVTVDEAGNVYVAGTTSSPDFPKTVHTLPARGGDEVFISKFNAAGTLIFSTVFGGSAGETVTGVAVDALGRITVVGYTDSSDFPVVNPIHGAFHPGFCGEFGSTCADGFVSTIDPTGHALLFSSYVGTTSDDRVADVAVDGAGNIYITGTTESNAFEGAIPQRPFGGTRDAFVAKIPPAGGRFVYFTFLGGTFEESGNGIAVDALGNADVTGVSSSQNFPILNPIQAVPENYSTSAFVTKLGAGGVIVYSTYLSGNDSDSGTRIAVDPSGAAYVVGITASTNFPTANPSQSFLRGRTDVFVSKLDPSGSRLVYSTYLGGSNVEQARLEFGPALDVAVDSAGNAYVAGLTQSEDFTAVNPFQRFGGGTCQFLPLFPLEPCPDAFVTKLDDRGRPVFSTPLGGNLAERGEGVAIAIDGTLYVVGTTKSSTFPLLAPARWTLSGSGDAFIVKISTSPALCELPAPVPLSPGGGIFDDRPSFSWQTVPEANAYAVFSTKLADVVLSGRPPGELLGVTQSTSLIPAAPIAPGDYGWSVVGWNRSCGFGASSRVQTFTLPGTCPLPPVVPTSPIEGANAKNPTRFEWCVDESAVASISVVVVLTAQGRFVAQYPASGSTFTMPMTLSVGDYAWVVVSGNSTCGTTVSAPAFFRSSGSS
jgi:hypothetical protein